MTPTLRCQYVFSGADGVGNSKAVLWCATNTGQAFVLVRARGKASTRRDGEIARTIKVAIVAVQHSASGHQTITKLTQPLDPRFEWPLIADYDIELVAGDPQVCIFIPTGAFGESR